MTLLIRIGEIQNGRWLKIIENRVFLYILVVFFASKIKTQSHHRHGSVRFFVAGTNPVLHRKGIK